MYILNFKNYYGRVLFRPRGKKQIRKVDVPQAEPVNNQLMTSVPNSLGAPQTIGGAMKLSKMKLDSIKLQNPEQKLKKFINLKL